MTVEKSIIAWETVMTILSVLMICSTLFFVFSINTDFTSDLATEIVILLPIFPFMLFLLIYFIMPQPFKDLLLKAKDVLPKRDLIFFHHDLLKVKVSTEYLDISLWNFSLSTSRDMKLKYHLQVSLMELSQEDQVTLEQEKKKKTIYAKWVIFLNVGSMSLLSLFIVAGRSQISFLEKWSILLFGLLIFLLYLRYSYNTYILLQFNKKLTQIEEISGLSYLDIRDIYE
jgi:hypothetical protein